MKKLIIRPSSLDTFLQCPQQWKRVHLDGENSIPSARAAIGTAIHRAAEVFWTDAIKTQVKDANIPTMTDAAIECFKEEVKKGLRYDTDENANTAEHEITDGVGVFVEDIAEYSPIPKAVEKRYTVPIKGSNFVEALSGTIDYISDDTIADVKTSRRKPTVANYETQQSVYKYLAVQNGETVKHSLIQGVILKKIPVGVILEAKVRVEQAKNIVNHLLHTLHTYEQDLIDPDILFRGNPKYYLCSEKYCNFYKDCKFVKNS